MRNGTLLSSLSLAACVAMFSGHASAQGCWNPQIGANLGLTDDSLAVGMALPFAFPMPGGGTTNLIDISSNGFIYLVSGSSTSSGCCSGDPAQLVSGPARIAPVWMDLNPTAGGSVHFNATATEAVVTWLGVQEYSSGGDNTVQLVLYPNGAFTITALSLNIPGSHDLLVGCSQGGGATDPGEVDFSAPTASGGVATHYELFTSGVDTRDLVGIALNFIPDGVGGYNTVPVAPCARFANYGSGCPQPPTFYELFTTTSPCDLAGRSFLVQNNGAGGWNVTPCAANCFDPNYAGNLGLTDDSVSGSQSLGFNFPLPGSPAGFTTAIEVSSNGFIWLIANGNTNSDLSESVSEFLAQPERLALIWDDLNPGAGGGVYFDAMPGKAMVTWAAVPEFGGSNPNTAQVQFFPSGDMIVSWDAGNTIADCLVGYSPGNGTSDPGMSDLTARVPFNTGPGGAPIHHFIGGSSLAVPGNTISLELANLHPLTAVAFMNIGFSRMNIDLTVIGMQGCTLLASIDGTLPMTITGSTAAVSIGIPNNMSLVGGNFYTQGLVIAPGTTTLGALASDAGVHTIGY